MSITEIVGDGFNAASCPIGLDLARQRVSSSYNLEALTYDGDYSPDIILASDLVTGELMRAVILSWRESWATDLTSPPRVLDLGAGTFMMTRLLRNNLGPRFSAQNPHGPFQSFSIDIAERMLQQGQAALAAEFGSADEPAILGDMHHLPFPDQSMDIVISGYGPVSYSPSLAVALKESVRTLNPKGICAFMPYPLRLGLQGFATLNGFTTATSSASYSTYHTRGSVTKSLEELGLDLLGVRGINFLGTYFSATQAVANEQTVQMEIEMDNLANLAGEVGPGDKLTNICNWNDFRMQADILWGNIVGKRIIVADKTLLAKYLAQESILAESLSIDPGLARFFWVNSQKK